MSNIDLYKLFLAPRTKGNKQKNTEKGKIAIFKDIFQTTNKGSEYLRVLMVDELGNICHGSIFCDEDNVDFIQNMTTSGLIINCSLTVSGSTKLFWTIRDITVLGITNMKKPTIAGDYIDDDFDEKIFIPKNINEGNTTIKDESVHTSTTVTTTSLDNMELTDCVNKLDGYINEIKDAMIRKFVEYAFTRLGYKQDMDFNTDDLISITCGNGTKGHHLYKWGLLDHLVGVTTKAVNYAKAYSGINMDLVIAGALLHDYGKFASHDKGIDTYNVGGQVLGHLVLGVSEIQKVACEIVSIVTDIDINKLDKLVMYLSGISTSHHGIEVYGNIRSPFCLESLIISQADMGDVVEHTYSLVSKESKDDVLQVLNERYIHPDVLKDYFSF